MKVEAPIRAYASTSSIHLASISKISSLSNLSLSEYSGPIAPGTIIEKTFVSADYALSFNITPHDSGHDYDANPSILQYHLGKGGAIQDVFFHRNTTKLSVSYKNTWLDRHEWMVVWKDLPLHSTTRVRVEAVGRYRTIFLNNTLLGNMKALNYTHDYGNATALLSSPDEIPADASISSIRMSPLITSSRVNSTGNTTDIPEVQLIYNSLFDDCSNEEGADAGCGRNLQCNSFEDGKATCGPVANSMVKLLHSIDDSEIDSIIISQRHQTCGSSSRYKNKCATIDGFSLTCTPVTAIVKGLVSEKSICLADFELNRLQKRPVSTFWYSGGHGANYRFV